MKIIFLDIDGVLNHFPWLAENEGSEPSESIDDRCVSLLNGIIERTAAKVVVSSTWRRLHPIEELREILESCGFEGEVIDYTTVERIETPSRVYWRGDEIAEWLDRHEVDSFVILDDDSDMGELLDRLVRTDFRDGLKEEHVEQAVKMLEGDQ